jgi:molybdate transport system substrate-binding protein
MRHRLAFALLTAVPLAFAAGAAGAADIKVRSASLVEGPLRHLMADFSRETGDNIEASFPSIGAIQAKLKAGDEPDVIVLPVAAMDEIDKAGWVVSASRAELGRAIAGVAVKAGVKEPVISTPDNFKKALLAAVTVAYTNPAGGSATGTYVAGLIEKLGIANEIKPMPQTGGGAVAAAVVKGEAEIGITYISELLPNRGLKVVGPIPQPMGLIVGYVAAVSSTSKENEAARALITYMTRPAAREIFKQAGL